MTKRRAPTGVWQERLLRVGSESGSLHVRNLVEPFGYRQAVRHVLPGHQVHFNRHKLSVREPAAVIPVTPSVDNDGVVLLDGDGLCLVRWNHRPALMRA